MGREICDEYVWIPNNTQISVANGACDVHRDTIYDREADRER